MSDEFTQQISYRPSFNQMALRYLQQLVALICIGEGVFYWIRILGVLPGDAWRVDLMPVWWQMTSVPLAVMFPFAAVGLWMLTSWGPAVWVLCAGAEVAMFAVFPEYFGHHPWILALHGTVALSYAVLRVLLHREERGRRQR